MNERELHALAQAWHAAGRAAVVIEVLQAQGSVPRGAGVRMLVDAAAQVGTIGGGRLELEGLQAARAWLAEGLDGPERVLRLPLGPALGQCCGGAVTLRLQPLPTALASGWSAPPPLFRLQLHGAGHVGRALARALEPIACEVDWVDEREDAFPASASPAHIRRRAAEEPWHEVAAAPDDTHFLVMTHQHALDLRLAEAILRRPVLAAFGLIGSATKRVRFERQLLARGIAPERIAMMRCPIGWSGIRSKAPELLAVAVLAELIAWAEPRRSPNAEALGRARSG